MSNTLAPHLLRVDKSPAEVNVSDRQRKRERTSSNAEAGRPLGGAVKGTCVRGSPIRSVMLAAVASLGCLGCADQTGAARGDGGRRSSDTVVAASRNEGRNRDTVKLWDTFEVTVRNSRSYENPFTDTELRAMFLDPAGDSIPFVGFYDGDGQGGQTGNVWRLRFLCTAPGEWRWRAGFSDRGHAWKGSFLCESSDRPGPLRADSSTLFRLADASGRPFHPRWLYVHDLVFLPEGRWQELIDRKVVEAGYNMVALVTTQAGELLRNSWNREAYERPLFYPWVRRGERVEWDRYDLRSWHKLDRMLAYLRERGVYAYDFDGYFPNIPPRFPEDAEAERRHLRFAVARLGAFPNIIHNITFEFYEFMEIPRVKRLGRYLEEIDPFDLLKTVHDIRPADRELAAEPWLDLYNLQYEGGVAGSADLAHDLVSSVSLGKPVAATEVVWEGADKLNGDEVRRGAWGVTMAGGFFLFGEFESPDGGFIPVGDGEAQPYLRVLYRLLDDLPRRSVRPLPRHACPGGLCLGDPGREYLVYVGRGGHVALDLTEAADDRFDVWWTDPRTGASRDTSSVMGGRLRRFLAPSGEQDWILHVRRSDA